MKSSKLSLSDKKTVTNQQLGFKRKRSSQSNDSDEEFTGEPLKRQKTSNLSQSSGSNVREMKGVLQRQKKVKTRKS